MSRPEAKGIKELFTQLGLGDYLQAFVEQEIDLETLPDLTPEELQSLIPRIGSRRKLEKYISSRRGALTSPPATPAPLPSPVEEGKLVELDPETHSEEHRSVTYNVKAWINNQIECYVSERVKAGNKPISFAVTRIRRVDNPRPRTTFEAKGKELAAMGRSKAELKIQTGFHGTHPANLKSIASKGLLKVGDPGNPNDAVDPGYFGAPTKGVYVARYIDYAAKYSNYLMPLEPGQSCSIVMLSVIPGRARHIEKLQTGIPPTPGFDCHVSPNNMEWYLFDSRQCLPTYIITLTAFANTRIAEDDEAVVHGDEKEGTTPKGVSVAGPGSPAVLPREEQLPFALRTLKTLSLEAFDLWLDAFKTTVSVPWADLRAALEVGVYGRLTSADANMLRENIAGAGSTDESTVNCTQLGRWAGGTSLDEALNRDRKERKEKEDRERKQKEERERKEREERERKEKEDRERKQKEERERKERVERERKQLAAITPWKLASSGPGLFGSVERRSDYSARHKGSFGTTACISGDTPLSSGVHAWRVKVQGLDEYGHNSKLGILQARKQLGHGSVEDPSFYGVWTSVNGFRYTAGKCAQNSGLAEIRSGDTLDFLLDVNAGSLTVITLKDNRRSVSAVPTGMAWVPHFSMAYPGNAFTVEVIAPKQAGKR